MRNLIELINKHNHFILFFLLELIAFSLVIQNNNFQRAAFINSTNGITANGYKAISQLKYYLSLKTTNDLLLIENASLKSLLTYQKNDSISSAMPFHFIAARVVNLSVARANNYITLDKGKADGVRKGMGVVTQKGVIGIVKEVSTHFSSIISVLHSKSKVSIVVHKNNHFGSLQWDGKNYKRAKILDIPSHVDVEIGDTIITSGFSNIFPANIALGTISKINTQDDDKFHDIKMVFLEDFKELKFVTICHSINSAEIDSLKFKND